MWRQQFCWIGCKRRIAVTCSFLNVSKNGVRRSQHILDVMRHSPHSTFHVSREYSSLTDISFSIHVKFLTPCSEKSFYFKVHLFFFFGSLYHIRSLVSKFCTKINYVHRDWKILKALVWKLMSNSKHRIVNKHFSFTLDIHPWNTWNVTTPNSTSIN